MKRPDIDAIKARESAATPGIWSREDSQYPSIINVCGPRLHITGILFAADTPDDQFQQVTSDADFIAASRQDIPDLIAYIEHLEARLEAKEPTCKPSLQVPQPEPDYTSETEDLSTWPQTRGKEWRRMGIGEVMDGLDVGFDVVTGVYAFALGWIGQAIGTPFAPSNAWTRRPPQTKGEG
jgi:hypothetical protein